MRTVKQLYVVQRKSDGLYYINDGYRGWSTHCREAHGELVRWTADINQCRPFRGSAAAKNALGFRTNFMERYTLIPVQVKIEAICNAN